MRIGRLRHKVTIVADVAGPDDAYGKPTTTPTVVAVCRAEVIEGGGDELRVAEQLKSIATHKVTLRNVAAITSAMRLTRGTRTLNILGVSLDPKGRIYTLACKEDASGG